jgi:hypothetical protein
VRKKKEADFVKKKEPDFDVGTNGGLLTFYQCGLGENFQVSTTKTKTMTGIDLNPKQSLI